ncbi:LysR substrate-binding domain-containing protein [Shinella sp. DD12]|jgi:LysR family glycine cleavage system transcriptional activator|uniref:LysR substrate-binding domain-containing protein n=1 Tax=unclassified Shinella TaxID=2643062 RepID=UPI0003C55763|nr:LysR substrate-binding domain-containing protein [Shinella sp. DD12]EYR79553.1 glycine cleavage system transcriptional activator [Shinella sp. DD12]MCA0341258.1 LysR family transcriptional regulator [Pseudomonadota bacterium]
MKRGRLPLTALRSFEAAGRLGSFTLAAEELLVSQAAVSRQVKELEAELGKPLFERRHRSVRLTSAGEALLDVLSRAFDAMDASLSEIRGRRGGGLLEISSEPSFAASWLVPHLDDFHADHPEIDVVVESDMRLIEFRAHEPEIAIRHGMDARAWPRVAAEHLADVELVPVVMPCLMEEGAPLRTPADILAYTLLHEENRSAWQRWFAAAGLADVPPGRAQIFTEGNLVLQAALRGHGVALVDRAFAAEDIAEGRLVQLFDISIQYGAYWLVARDFKRLSPEARAFREWLLLRFAVSGS